MKNQIRGHTSGIRGLTLVELLIAITILGLLAAVTFPVFASARERRNITTCAGNLSRIGQALRLYQADWDGQLPPRNPAFWRRDVDWSAPWQGYGLTREDLFCPNKTNVYTGAQTSYEFRLSLLCVDHNTLSVDLNMSASPVYGVNGLPAYNYRTLVAEPDSVLVECEQHVRLGNTRPMPGRRWLSASGCRLGLRADGHVDSVPAASCVYWGRKDKDWYRPGSQWPSGASAFLVFPNEPWPPKLK